MRLRHKLAFSYFFGAIACFIIGYGAAWASAFGTHKPADTAKTTLQASPPTADTQAKQDQSDKKKPSPKAGTTYTVKSGDTLSSVAGQYGITFEQLAQYNNIPYPYNLSVGQTLTIPAK